MRWQSVGRNVGLTCRALPYPDDLRVVRVRQGRRFELVINLKTAKALGVDIPISMQLLADEVIE